VRILAVIVSNNLAVRTRHSARSFERGASPAPG
jgi:hypothetical protein